MHLHLNKTCSKDHTHARCTSKELTNTQLYTMHVAGVVHQRIARTALAASTPPATAKARPALPCIRVMPRPPAVGPKAVPKAEAKAPPVAHGPRAEGPSVAHGPRMGAGGPQQGPQVGRGPREEPEEGYVPPPRHAPSHAGPEAPRLAEAPPRLSLPRGRRPAASWKTGDERLPCDARGLPGLLRCPEPMAN